MKKWAETLLAVRRRAIQQTSQKYQKILCRHIDQGLLLVCAKKHWEVIRNNAVMAVDWPPTSDKT